MHMGCTTDFFHDISSSLPYGGLFCVANDSMAAHGPAVGADLCSNLHPPDVASFMFLYKTKNKSDAKSVKQCVLNKKQEWHQ